MLHKIVIAANYPILANRIGGIDRFFWALDESLKKRNIVALWIFPSSKDAYIYTDKKFNIIFLSPDTFIMSLTEWIKSQDSISLLVTHFIPYNTKYNWIWKLGSVRKIIAVDHMSRPVLSKHGIKKIIFTIKGAINFFSIDGIIAVSDFVKICILNELGNIWNKKIKVVYNGVDTSLFGVDKIALNDDNPFVILFFGHLIREKGVQVLIQAISMVDACFKGRIKLIIAGDGTYRNDLANQVKSLKIESIVSFIGNIPDNFEVLKKANVVVVPSLWQEAFGLTVAEALASGVPVVASDIGAIPEILPNGKAGLLFNPQSPKDLKACLVYLLQNPVIAQEMGQFAHTWIRDHFTLDRMVADHTNILIKEVGI